MIAAHEARAQANALRGERSGRPGQDGPPVRPDHSMGAGHPGMVEEPRGHGPRGSDVPKARCNRPTGGHTPLRDGGDARHERLPERRGHDLW